MSSQEMREGLEKLRASMESANEKSRAELLKAVDDVRQADTDEKRQVALAFLQATQAQLLA